MARRSVDVRVAKWTAKMEEGALSPTMKRRLERAREKYITAAERSVQIEDSVKVVLNGAEAEHPVPLSSVPSYLAFARQVAKAKDTFTGDTVSVRIDDLETSWAGRGIDPVIMARIVKGL